jgi:hypothetical protein
MSIKGTSKKSSQKSRLSNSKDKKPPASKPKKTADAPGGQKPLSKKETSLKSLSSITAVAAEYGLTERTVKYHVSRGNLKRNPDGSFSRTEIKKWLDKRSRQAIGKTAEETHRAADFRWRLARAKREEYLLEQLKGELIPIKVLEEQVTGRAFEASRRFLLLPRIISNKIAIAAKRPLKEVMQIVEESVREILEDYSRALDIKGDK